MLPSWSIRSFQLTRVIGPVHYAPPMRSNCLFETLQLPGKKQICGFVLPRQERRRAGVAISKIVPDTLMDGVPMSCCYDSTLTSITRGNRARSIEIDIYSCLGYAFITRALSNCQFCPTTRCLRREQMVTESLQLDNPTKPTLLPLRVAPEPLPSFFCGLALQSTNPCDQTFSWLHWDIHTDPVSSLVCDFCRTELRGVRENR